VAKKLGRRRKGSVWGQRRRYDSRLEGGRKQKQEGGKNDTRRGEKHHDPCFFPRGRRWGGRRNQFLIYMVQGAERKKRLGRKAKGSGKLGMTFGPAL